MKLWKTGAKIGAILMTLSYLHSYYCWAFLDDPIVFNMTWFTVETLLMIFCALPLYYFGFRKDKTNLLPSGKKLNEN